MGGSEDFLVLERLACVWEETHEGLREVDHSNEDG